MIQHASAYEYTTDEYTDRPSELAKLGLFELPE